MTSEITIPKFKTKPREELTSPGARSFGYREFLKVVEKYKDSGTCVACTELCTYLGIKKATLRDYARNAEIVVSILTDSDKVYWVAFYTKETG